MSKFLITGGTKLNGVIKVSGSKNSALPLLAASLLGDSPSVFTNVPVIKDVEVMGRLIEKLGAKVEGLGTGTLKINPGSLSSYELDPALTERIRGSVILAAPLIARFGKAIITPPGGDQIGERLLDTHFSMMQKFGVKIKKENGKYLLSWDKKKEGNIFLEEASVTATEMALMLGSNTKGDIVLEDVASEPHVVDLADYLNKSGMKIKGAGTNTVRISKGKLLKGVSHRVIPDHIEGATLAIAAAITGGKVIIKDVVYEHYKIILNYLSQMGVSYKFAGKDAIQILPSKLVAKRRKFQTRPWPGFPTDLMSPFIVLATQTKGTVLCHDWMYEWRVFFVDDLISMGANIFIADPHRVIVTGPTKLNAEKVFCKDIRAGISIILAALVAEGVSTIDNVEMVERGYERIEERFKNLGAKIKRVDHDE